MMNAIMFVVALFSAVFVFPFTQANNIADVIASGLLIIVAVLFLNAHLMEKRKEYGKEA